MYDVTAIGELLIDFTPSGQSEKGNDLFECNPGGAPANVLAALARLGRNTAFIGKVGNDRFGRFLANTLTEVGVDTKGLVFSEEGNTTLAFVHLNSSGDRSFSFYRKPGADMLLRPEEILPDLVEQSRIFHFGSVSMTHEPSRSATLTAVKAAKEQGAVISYDPNLRPLLWESLDEAKRVMREGMKYCDVLKISEEELVFFTGVEDLQEGSSLLWKEFNTALIFITLGAEGCFYRQGDMSGQIPTYDVKTIDTTGAGDAFLGGMLHRLLEVGKKPGKVTLEELETAVSFANAVGSLATTKKGAIPAMPALEEVERCMRENKRVGSRE
jgi:fructokinase